MIQIKVSGLPGSPELTLDLCETEEQLRLLTVRDLKKKISSKTGIDKDRLWLITSRTERDDNCSLFDCRITVGTNHYIECLYPGKIQLNVKTLTGKCFCICLDDLDQTVLDIKYRIQDSEGIPPDQQRILNQVKQFEDDSSLSECGLRHMDTVFLVLKLHGGGNPAENSGNMGDRDGKNASMDFLANFDKPSRCNIS